MKYPTDADIARADMYEDGAINLREYREECINTKPGACDESFGGGGGPPIGRGFSIVAGAVSTKLLPHGPNMLLASPAGGKWVNYRIGGELVDINTQNFRVQQRFFNGKHGYYINEDDPYDAPWFKVYGHKQSPTKR